MQRISGLYEKSGARAFGLTPAEFERVLSEAGGACDGRYVQELVLARACARGNEQAWEYFIAVYRPKLYAAARVITRDDCSGRELADTLYADLFGVAVRVEGRSNSKFEYYLGRGPLEGWLRTVLAQEYVNRLRHGRKLCPFDEATLDAPVSEPVETESEKRLLAACTDKVLARLSDEDRLLLVCYFLDGRTLAYIGRMLNVHETTVSRRLEKTTTAVRKRIIAELRVVGVPKREAEGMLQQVDVRDLGVNVRERLAQGRQP